MGRSRAAEANGGSDISARPRSDWSSDSDQSEVLFLLYDELSAGRERLASLPPVTPQDLERVSQAMHETVMYVLMRNGGTLLDGMSDTESKNFSLVAKGREADLYAATVALVALKLDVRRRQSDRRREQLGALRDLLDSLTFDFRATKGATLELLKDIRRDLDARLAYVSTGRRKWYRFPAPPEQYSHRANRREKPDAFFGRVYAEHVPRGLTQADIRKADPAYYNVLHVWCSRHAQPMSKFVPAARLGRDPSGRPARAGKGPMLPSKRGGSPNP